MIDYAYYVICNTKRLDNYYIVILCNKDEHSPSNIVVLLRLHERANNPQSGYLVNVTVQ